MSKKIPQLVLGAVLLVIIGAAVYMGATGNFSQKQCTVSHDACLIQAAEDERKVRDAFIDAKNQELIDFSQKVSAEINEQESKSRVIINGYKDQLSPPTIESEYKANRLQNVPDRLLNLMVTQVQASEVEDKVQPHIVWPSMQETVSGQDNATKVSQESYDRPIPLPEVSEVPGAIDSRLYNEYKLSLFLEETGSPFAKADIYPLARQYGLTEEQLIFLMGITFQESNFGKHFVNHYNQPAQEIGLTYHNPAGNKNYSKALENCPANRSFPDENKMDFKKYDSWNQFFGCYFQQMKAAYFDKGADTPVEVSKFYLTGDPDNWINGVTDGMNQIKAFYKNR